MKILVLCSGGDAPGMNKFVAELYKKYKTNLYFAYAGFTGLVNGEIYKVEEIFDKTKTNEAGAMIKSSRCPEFKQKKVFEMGLKNAQQFDCTIILGGNGSQKGAKQLFENGVNTIFVPGTIDNDVDDCKFSIGFLTAVKEVVYTIQNTMPSVETFNHSCLFEVMGRESDEIANAVADIVKADYVIGSKSALDYEKIKNVILQKYINGKSALIVVRENLVNLKSISTKLEELLGLDIVKTQVVGRTQRGGKPTQDELLLAKKYAENVIKNIKNKKFGIRVLANENKQIITKMFK